MLALVPRRLFNVKPKLKTIPRRALRMLASNALVGDSLRWLVVS